MRNKIVVFWTVKRVCVSVCAVESYFDDLLWRRTAIWKILFGFSFIVIAFDFMCISANIITINSACVWERESDPTQYDYHIDSSAFVKFGMVVSATQTLSNNTMSLSNGGKKSQNNRVPSPDSLRNVCHTHAPLTTTRVQLFAHGIYIEISKLKSKKKLLFSLHEIELNASLCIASFHRPNGQTIIVSYFVVISKSN